MNKSFNIGPFTINNPYILAPMAGVSQMPFRRIALKMGAGLAPTELVSAKGLFYESLRTKSYLLHDKSIEKPFCVQLFGAEPESMGIAAKKAVDMGADIIDINMGCPVKKVTKTNAGSALLVDTKRACDVVEAILKQTNHNTPVTAKIRSGWDNAQLNYQHMGKSLQEVGVSALAIHARTRAQGYSGKADWSHIAELKSELSIPVIGNGDITSLKDAKRMFKETNCDAVMIGRGALGNPWIFRDLVQDQEIKVFFKERHSVVLEHFLAHIEFNKMINQEEKQAIRSFRSHLIWYSKGLTDGAKFRNEVMTSECKTKIISMIDTFFGVDNSLVPWAGMHDDGIDYRQAFG